jgi:hypothetical protein
MGNMSRAHPTGVIETKCRGEICKLGFVNGRLVMLTHNYRRECNLVALGGEPCQCLCIMRAWKFMARGEQGPMGPIGRWKSQIFDAQDQTSRLPVDH